MFQEQLEAANTTGTRVEAAKKLRKEWLEMLKFLIFIIKKAGSRLLEPAFLFF